MSVAETRVLGALVQERRRALDEVVRRDPWRKVRLALFTTYGVAYGLLLLTEGLVIDRVSVLICFAILLVIATVGRPLHRWGRVLIDFALYTSMWFVYEESRGAADRLGFPLQVESVRNIDRFMFFGVDPNVWLQEHFLETGTVRWYDVVASIVYYSHFVLPPAVIVVLWVMNRREWLRFVKRFATTLLIAFTMFVVLPTAPPWMAGGGDREIRLNALEPLRRTAGRGWTHLGLERFEALWDTGRDWANKVAAMPSLHAGYSLLVVAFFLPWIANRWMRAALLAFPVVMTIVLVYLAEHYVIDALAGFAVVGFSFVLWNRIEHHQRQHKLALTKRALAVACV